MERGKGCRLRVAGDVGLRVMATPAMDIRLILKPWRWNCVSSLLIFGQVVHCCVGCRIWRHLNPRTQYCLLLHSLVDAQNAELYVTYCTNCKKDVLRMLCQLWNKQTERLRHSQISNNLLFSSVTIWGNYSGIVRWVRDTQWDGIERFAM